MKDNYSGPLAVSERIEVIDVLRGLAICGILIGNMQWFSGYGFIPLSLAADRPLSDQITHFLVHFLVEGKFYSIFSFLFGFGFALQMARAETRGEVTASTFKRRLFWLLVIGLIHAVFVWAGDILSVYALIGFVLLLFRRKPERSLLKWSAGLLLVPIIVYAILYALFVAFAPAGVDAMVEEAQNQMWTRALLTVPNSGYIEISTSYNLNMLAGRWAGLIVQMRLPKILAMFLIGLWAYRKGVFQNMTENRRFISRIALWGLAIGVAGNLLFAWAARSEADLPPTFSGLIGVAAYAFSVPALALGIAASVTLLWQYSTAQRVLAVLAPVGRMALTNYLLQSAICVTIFYGYGFGFFGSVGALQATLIALAIFAIQIVLSTVWLRSFAFGPMEWVWRQLTYRRRLSLRERTA